MDEDDGNSWSSDDMDDPFIPHGIHRALSASDVRSLLSAGYNVNFEEDHGCSLLHETESIEIAKALLDGGAKIEQWSINEDTDYAYGTPLTSQTNEDIALLLIERGANVNPEVIIEEDGLEKSALWKHVRHENARVVREMVRKGVRVGPHDLLAATRNSSDVILRILVKHIGESVTNKLLSTTQLYAGLTTT